MPAKHSRVSMFACEGMSREPRLVCPPCSVGVHLNVAGHANDHAYKVVQSLGFPLYHPAWRVRVH